MNPGSPPTSDGRSMRTGRDGPAMVDVVADAQLQQQSQGNGSKGQQKNSKEKSSIWSDHVPLTCLSKPRKPSPTTSDEHTNIPAT